jgi:Ca-activated chloride channel family protein
MEFMFIRPDLLWLLLPWLVLTTLQFIRSVKNKHSPLIAPHLANIMLSDGKQKSKSHNPVFIAVFMLIAIICAAGPSFEKQQVPVFQTKQARVILMDMSYSMFSTDITPNRLTQARFKTLDMIELFKEGDTALVAYAGDAFTVSPLTSDAKTLSNLIPSLSPDIMPSKGSNVLAGIDQSISLLKQAGYQNGEIVLITDGIDQSDVDDIRSELKNHAYTLHIYAVGTEQGAPIALPEGGYLKDSRGQIVVPKLNVPRLSSLARSYNGQFAAYSPVAHDLTIFKPQTDNKQINETRQSDMLWRIDAGQYGLFFLLPLALLLIRKSGLALSLLVFVLLPNEQVYAADWQTWFKNNDQNALSAYKQEQFSAAGSADNLALKGAALYKQGQFEEAANVLKNAPSAIGQYNYANALAKSGKLEAALEAYDSALKQNPEFQQAIDNKKLVKDLLNQKQEQQQDQNQDQNQEQQNNEQQDNQSDQQQSDGKQSDKQSGDEQQQSEQDKSNSSNQTNEGQNNSPDMQSDTTEPENKQDDNSAQAQQSKEQLGEKDNQTEQEMRAQQQAQQSEQAAEPSPEKMGEVTAQPLTPEEKEKAQQLSQLLRKVPDDPAILLRNKMQLEAQQRAQQQRRRQGVEKSW